MDTSASRSVLRPALALRPERAGSPAPNRSPHSHDDSLPRSASVASSRSASVDSRHRISDNDPLPRSASVASSRSVSVDRISDRGWHSLPPRRSDARTRVARGREDPRHGCSRSPRRPARIHASPIVHASRSPLAPRPRPSSTPRPRPSPLVHASRSPLAPRPRPSSAPVVNSGTRSPSDESGVLGRIRRYVANWERR